MLALPKEGPPYSLDTDESSCQVRAALFQTDADGVRHPIGYWSCSLNVHEKNYSIPENEFLAAVWALQTLRLYPQVYLFTVHSDQALLR